MTAVDRWVARLTAADGDVEGLLVRASGLDVWERRDSVLVVAADESRLRELERRGLAIVERLERVADFIERSRNEGLS